MIFKICIHSSSILGLKNKGRQLNCSTEGTARPWRTLLGLISWGSVLLFASTSQAFDLGAGLTPPKYQRPTVSYTGLLHGSSEFQDSQSQMTYQALSISTPVWKTENEIVSVSLSGNQLSVRPTQSSISELYDLRLGLGYTKMLENDRVWSVAMRYGSASDRPFKDASVSTLGATALYAYPSSSPDGRWLLLLDYSNNRPILNNLPLPGFAYFHTPSPKFRAVYGAPFANVNWRFVDNWSLELFTLFPWIIQGSLNYHINDYAKIYTGLDFSQMTYYIFGRANKKDRLFYDEKKLFLGIKSPLSRIVSVELETGYAFDRRFFSDENYQRDPSNAVLIENAPYAKLNLRFRF